MIPLDYLFDKEFFHNIYKKNIKSPFFWILFGQGEGILLPRARIARVYKNFTGNCKMI